MEALYRWELPLIARVQETLRGPDGAWEEGWVGLTKAGDPAWVFLVYFPLLLPFLRGSALRFLTAGILAEFLNGLLKWLLHGERPFWASGELGGPALRQFRYSCETGPGSPSGHVMVSAAVASVLVLQLGPGPRRRWAWAGLAVALALVGVSRVFIAAHFLHQVALGAGGGLAVGSVVAAWHPDGWGPGRFLATALVLMGLGLGTAATLAAQHVQLDWSVHKAVRACERAEWVHVSTTPLSALLRDLAALAALALLAAKDRLRVPALGRSRAAAVAAASLGLVQTAKTLLPFPSALGPFYASYFLFNAAVILLCFAAAHSAAPKVRSRKRS